MPADRPARRVPIPRMGTLLTIAASLAAGGMLVSSAIMGWNSLAALRDDNPVTRIQAVETLVNRGRDGVPELPRIRAGQDRYRRR